MKIAKLELRQNLTFSEEFKKKKVKELIQKQITVSELRRLYGISRTSIYNWLSMRCSNLKVHIEPLNNTIKNQSGNLYNNKIWIL